MKAGLREKIKKVNCVDLPVPQIKDDEVLVKVDSVGICGSDINRIAEDNPKWDKIVLGHEFAGEITEIGSEVNDLKQGDRVSAAPLMPCHNCDKCQDGLYSLCKSYSFIGSRVNGAMAEYVAVPGLNIVKLPDEVSFEKAVLIEPVTVCLHALINQADYSGKDVLVTGAGAIGLLAMQIFKVMGAKRVIVSDIVDYKLDMAEKTGADLVVNVLKDNLKTVLEGFLNTDGVDLVFESSGSNPAKKTALEVTKGRGEIIQVGTSPCDITFEAKLYELITRKELIIRGSWMNYSAPFPGKEWKTAVELLRDNKLRIDDLITHRYSLGQIGQAYDMIFGQKEDFIKVIIKP